MLLNLSGVQNFNTNFIPFALPPSPHATHFSYPSLSLSHCVSAWLCFCLAIRFLTVGENLWRGQSENCKTISAKTQNTKQKTKKKEMTPNAKQVKKRRKEEKQRKKMSKKKTPRRRFVWISAVAVTVPVSVSVSDCICYLLDTDRRRPHKFANVAAAAGSAAACVTACEFGCRSFCHII